MDVGTRAPLPRSLDYGRVGHVADLFQNVELREPTGSGIAAQSLQFIGVAPDNALEVFEPTSQGTARRTVESRGDSAAVVVAANNHVAYSEGLDRVLQDGETRRIGRRGDVRNVPVDEDLAGLEVEQVLRTDAAVRASDPKQTGALGAGDAPKRFSVQGNSLPSPLSIAP